MDWEHFLHYDLYIDCGWFGFHVTAVLVLLIPFLFVLWRSRSHGIWAVVSGMAAVTLNIHMFEVGHSLTQFTYSGVTGVTVLINMAIIFLVGMVLYMVMKPKFGVFSPSSWSLVSLGIMAGAFITLGESGFFDNYPYSIRWGLELLFTQLATNTFICSLFLGDVIPLKEEVQIV